jgi:hypothetical protein
VPGYTKAAQDLSSVYARVVTTDPIVSTVAEQSGLSPAKVRGALSASPIPDSAIIRVEATATSGAEAKQIADLSTAALAAYVHELNSVDPTTLPAYKEYNAAADAYAAALLTEDDAQKYLTQLRTPGSLVAFSQGEQLQAAIGAARLQLIAAKSDTLQKKLQLDGLGATYANAVSGQGARSDLSPLGAASSTGNNRRSTLEIGVLAGLVGGALLGLGLVTARANRLRLRALRHSTTFAVAS